MSLLAIDVFGGEIPKIATHLLPDKNASHAEDCLLEEGMLSPWRADDVVNTLLSTNILKLSEDQTERVSSILKYNDYWYGFNEKVSFAKAPVIGDVNDRIIISGSGEPRVTDELKATHNNLDSLLLGIPKPASKPVVSVFPIGNEPRTEVFYVYTYVREWSDGKVDEGPPSAPSEIRSTNDDDGVSVDAIKVPANYQDIGLSKVRIYRTRVGETTTEFAYVGEEAITSTEDIIFWDGVNEIDLGEVLPSSSWTPPTEGLTNIINIGKGLMAGFEGNTLYLSDEFQAHAWPSTNAYVVEHPIVGLGTVGDFVVVLTEGSPILFYVQGSTSVQQISVNENLPCLSPDSIVSTRFGVYYASSVGMVVVTQDGPKVLTSDIFSEEDWFNLNPSSMRSTYFDNKLFFFWDGSEQRDADGKIIRVDTGRGGYILDLSEPNIALVRTSVDPLALYSDATSDALYYATPYKEGEYSIFSWGSSYLEDKNYRWKSKEYISKQGRINYGAGRVIADTSNDNILEQRKEVIDSILENLLLKGRKSAINTRPINTLPINGSLLSKFTYEFNSILYFYADGKLVFTKTIKDDRLFKLPTAFSGKRFMIEVRGNLPIRQLQVATSAMEVV